MTDANKSWRRSILSILALVLILCVLTLGVLWGIRLLTGTNPAWVQTTKTVVKGILIGLAACMLLLAFLEKKDQP